MKSLCSIRIILVVAASVLVVVAIGSEKYESTYDDLDVEKILKDDAERNRYYACFMDTGPCHTDAAVFFKSKAPEAVITSCKFCTDKQLQMFEKIVNWFVDNKPAEWNILIEKTIQDARKKGLVT